MSVMSILSSTAERVGMETASAPNAIDLLQSQHREVEALFKQLEETSDRAYKAREHLFEEIARKLTHHAKIEEKLFYPEGREADEDMTLEAVEEHEVMKHLISRIRRTDSRDETFMAKCTVLKEVVEHHVKEEESEYLPKCKKTMSDEELDELGLQMKTLFDRLEAQSSQRSARKDH
jgi:hemerythrin superfamily protein